MKKRKGFKSIKGRFTFLLLIAALLPLCTVAVITSFQRYNAIKKREFRKLIAIRDLKVEQVNQWLLEKSGDVRTMADDPEIRVLESLIQRHEPGQNHKEKVEHARVLLKRYVRNYSDYAEIFIVNPSTKRIEVSTDSTSEGEARSGMEYVDAALKKGGLYIQNIYYSKALKGPSMAFSIPIFDPEQTKEVLGVLVARIDLNRSLYPLLLNRAGMGSTGETLIVDEEGRALNELRWHHNAPLRLRITAEPAALAVEGKTGIVEGDDYRGVPVLAAYTFIPKTRWGFVAKEDLSEAYAPIYSMLWDIGLLFVLAVAGVYILAVFLARTISRPVKEMAAVSKKIKEGDLTARNSIEGRDELGFLAESINSMADAIALHSEMRQVNDDITHTLVDAKDLSEFRISILKKLVTVTESQMGVYFLLNRETRMFEPFFSIGLDSSLLKAYNADRLEGELGMVAISKKITRITDIPEKSIFKFKTFTGDILPKEIISIPMVIDSEVSGIVSLAGIKPYSHKVLEIMNQPWATGFGTALANMWANEETARLAKELEASNQRLQAQAEELQAQAEEMAAQTRELQQNAEELQQQNLELESQREQVESASRLKSEFLSNMSHELRTPLNSVLALSRVLVMQARHKLSSEEQSYLEIIEKNGRNLLLLINDILDLSKIEAGRMDFHPKSFSIKSTVETIVERLEPMALEKGIQLVHDLPNDLAAIESDEVRVHQILQNLMANAVKFTQDGSVVISASTSGNHISIQVTDTGIGIAKSDLLHIFEEFRQVDGSTSRSYEGTGLGLAIAQKTAKVLGGGISVESQPGRGSTFTLVLPMKWRVDLPKREPLKLKPISMEGGPRPAVLVIDDDPEAAAIISDYLSREGYAVITAGSGREGVQKARKYRPFAITLDILMPEMDGWEVLQELKQSPETVDIPVIVVSVSPDRKTGLALGAVGFVTKPVTRARLIGEIRGIDGPAPHAVMIADDDGVDRREIARMVAEEGMKPIPVENGFQCMDQLKEFRPDVLVLDLMMPGMDGFEVLRRVRKDPDAKGLPVIVVTAKDLTSADKAQLSGNVCSVLAKSETTPGTLLEELRRLLFELRKSSPAIKRYPRLLLVEDNEGAVVQVKSILEDVGYIVDVARNGQEAIDFVGHTIPDGLILDLMMPKIDGFEVLERIRATRATAHLPVLILTARDLTPEDLRKLSENNVSQLVQKGDVDREGLLRKTGEMLGAGINSGMKEAAPDRNHAQRLEVENQSSELSEAQNPAVGYRIQDRRHTILVVEDNPDNMITIKAVLQNRYALLEAGDGETALKTVRSEHPRLVLLDMSLPKMDGFEVVRKMKEDPETQHIPVIALTAHAMKGDREKVIEAGCDDYIAKPIEPENFQRKIAEWFRVK